ncbi:MAG TPA: imidazole glycerol phosphate synthase subunit HisH [Actinomycetota bacterium]|nr:imidazole glycerol phosphate synthase subunit HisH [Actinomycetota bacterium]
MVDHGMGNLRSVAKALEAAGADVVVTADAGAIERGDALCVPGQGIFGRCMAALSETALGDVVRGWIESERPFLGICLGMQILFDTSEEAGSTPGLGVMNGRVVRLPDTVTVPHIGWNTLVSSDSEEGEAAVHYYFDHSYGVIPDDDSVVAGWCHHGSRFAAMVRSGPILAVQFHPEKSGGAGIALLERWVHAA